LVGVSLGGNVALKWLGERGRDARAAGRSAGAISTPFGPADCARGLRGGVPRALYTPSFLPPVKPQAAGKSHPYGRRLHPLAARRARTFGEYDRFVTAPIFGFADERDYWARSSSRPYLEGIRRPTLLINAVNDPFVPPSALPEAEVAASPWLEADFVS